ncbi:tyrosine-protein kinase receptor UFO-like [Pelodiscus sinensis]|uniref:tyrosine-protein kinase receptor UFO-like n=1 Tax=Pelodiscus sinensis TaxID=13735 RepID=UPI003F6D432A
MLPSAFGRAPGCVGGRDRQWLWLRLAEGWPGQAPQLPGWALSCRLPGGAVLRPGACGEPGRPPGARPRRGEAGEEGGDRGQESGSEAPTRPDRQGAAPQIHSGCWRFRGADMGTAGSPLLCLLAACWLGTGAPQAALHFLESPSNLTASLGKDVRLRCAVRLGQEPPDIGWLRDGRTLELADTNQMQMPVTDRDWLAVSELSIPAVQLSDAGSYQCAVQVQGQEVLSDAAHLGLEGLPFFSEEPQDLEVAADTPFNLSCSAQGPPDPVRVVWLQNGAPRNSLVEQLAQVPSTLAVSGEWGGTGPEPPP